MGVVTPTLMFVVVFGVHIALTVVMTLRIATGIWSFDIKALTKVTDNKSMYMFNYMCKTLVFYMGIGKMVGFQTCKLKCKLCKTNVKPVLSECVAH